MNHHRLLCPQCRQKTGVLTEEVPREDERAEHIPEGLAGFTIAQCERCAHEWHVVSRRQIMQSIRLWDSHPTGGLS